METRVVMMGRNRLQEILVGGPDYRVVDNPLKCYNFNLSTR